MQSFARLHVDIVHAKCQEVINKGQQKKGLFGSGISEEILKLAKNLQHMCDVSRESNEDYIYISYDHFTKIFSK